MGLPPLRDSNDFVLLYIRSTFGLTHDTRQAPDFVGLLHAIFHRRFPGKFPHARPEVRSGQVCSLFQTLLYVSDINISLITWLCPVCGGLMLIWAESRNDSRKMFASLPTLSDGARSKNWLQFCGRILVVLMFLTLFDTAFNAWYQLVQVPIAAVFMFLVAIGYKTKLSALVLVIWLNILNFYNNSWWTMDPDFKFYRDRLRIQFFTVVSVIGGLLLVVYLGAGGVSVDSYKKRW